MLCLGSIEFKSNTRVFLCPKIGETSKNTSDYPAVGDWVNVDRNTNKTGDAIIIKVLPRRTSVSRKVAGLDNERLKSYNKLLREAKYLKLKNNKKGIK